MEIYDEKEHDYGECVHTNGQESTMTNGGEIQYDVGISCAGEDRDTVERVLLELAKRNVRTFYDLDERARLWGEDLAELLPRIYLKQCRFFMPFISESYVKKAFPKFEYKRALEKAIRTDDAFIIPVQLEDVKFDLLGDNVAYLDIRTVSPEEIAETVVTKLGYGAGRPAPPTSPSTSPPTVSKHLALSTWEPGIDPRVMRHKEFVSQQYPWWEQKPRLTMLTTSPTATNIDQDVLNKTFLDTTVRYAEGLNYARRIQTHALGFTREFPDHRREENREPSESWTCYLDGLIACEIRPSQEEDGKPWLNLNAVAYEVLRVLQLSAEVFSSEDEIDVLVDLTNPSDLVVPVFAHGTVAEVHTYAGYHQPIVGRYARTDISDRERWNVICDPVVDVLTQLARVYGLPRLPQAYWDDQGVLDYSKIASRE
jgi:hypothetical protein